MGLGELAALSAAFLWTCSSMFWGKIDLSAMGLNLCKNVIGSALILLHMLALFFVADRALFQAPISSWTWLGISGLIGVVIGDTFYFRSLQILGPRRALMMSTTAPLFSAGLGFVLLGEDLHFFALVGIVITISGVLIVIRDRKAGNEAPGLHPGAVQLGVLSGIGGSACQAIGSVFAKKGMLAADGTDVCDPVEATFIRLLISAVATIVIVALSKKLFVYGKQSLNWKTLKLLIPATAIGTWIGIWLSQIAFRSSDVAIAQTLLATCPLFAIPVVWIVHRQRVTPIAIFGTVIALIGIFLTVFDFNEPSSSGPSTDAQSIKREFEQ